jgi:hypothetical protein
MWLRVRMSRLRSPAVERPDFAPKLTKVANLYAGSPAVRSASDKGSAIDAWKATAAHIPLMV